MRIGVQINRWIIVIGDQVLSSIGDFAKVFQIGFRYRIYMTPIDENKIAFVIRIVANELGNSYRRIPEVSEKSSRKRFAQILGQWFRVAVMCQVEGVNNCLVIGCEKGETAMSVIEAGFADVSNEISTGQVM